MKRCLAPCLLLSLCVVEPILAQAPGRRVFGGGSGVRLARLADADRSGDVTAAEWRALLKSLPEDARNGVDRNLLLARLLGPTLTGGAGTAIGVKDLDKIFATRDRDQDGALRKGEWQTARGSASGGFVGTIMLHSADADRDGAVTAAEWAAFRKPLKDLEHIPHETVGTWLKNASTMTSANRGAMTPDVVLATIDAGLDPNHDGVVRHDDLTAMFRALDLDKDGALQKSEMQAALARPGNRRVRGRGARGAAGRRRGTRRTVDKTRPPLMPWQRSLEDALALVAKTGKPLLICVNMDGESACESLAWGRYRDPKFAALAAGFIPILASPDRHTLVDYDDRGRRMVDPRFGRLVDREHIDHEPMLYQKYFRKQRVAPRHVGVDKDGKILFDIYLVQDLGVIDAALRKHGVHESGPVMVRKLDERALFASPDAVHRAQLEQRFVDGDRATRLRLVGQALSAVRPTQHPELVRLALRDPDPGVRLAGVRVVAAHPAAVPVDLVRRAFYCCGGDLALHGALVTGLHTVAGAGRDAAAKQVARELMRIQSGLATRSTLLDVGRWVGHFAGLPRVQPQPPTEDQLDALNRRLDELEKQLKQDPDDRELRLAQAVTTLRFARLRAAQGQDPSFLLQDAHRAATRATTWTEPDGLALAHMAVASHLLSQPARATEEAARALRALGGAPDRAASPLAAEVLDIFAKGRTRDLYAAMRAEREWPANWIADIRAAYDILLAHPASTPANALGYVDWLGALNAWAAEDRVAVRALARFPMSNELHAKFRAVRLTLTGAAGLEQGYVELLARFDQNALLQWQSGLASLLAGDRYFGGGQPKTAEAAYRRSVTSFESSVRMFASYAASAQHYCCLAHASIARVRLGLGDLPAAVQAMTHAIEARAASMKTKSGLGKTPLETAIELRRALQQKGMTAAATQLEELLRNHGLLGG